jgi:hypothetical protein
MQSFQVKFMASQCQGHLELQVRNIVPNDDEGFVDASGYPLPPCIVMERGESLDVWAARAKPDRSQAFSVRSFHSAATHVMHAR